MGILVSRSFVTRGRTVDKKRELYPERTINFNNIREYLKNITI
jgi:hypothetical protein